MNTIFAVSLICSHAVLNCPNLRPELGRIYQNYATCNMITTKLNQKYTDDGITFYCKAIDLDVH